MRGINVVMKRDIAADPHFAGSLPADTYFDFATPYGYGGWLLEGRATPRPSLPAMSAGAENTASSASSCVTIPC